MSSGKIIAIFGANGGIGKAFVDYYLAQPGTDHIFAFSRTAIQSADERLTSILVDVLDETSIAEAIEHINEQKITHTIIALGTLHTDERMPEKQLSDLTMHHLEDVFRINTFAPALIMKHIKPYINKTDRNVVACLSARVGSISDNRLGGWYSYRASKAALNMLIRTTAIEFKRSLKRSIVIGLHPGTVDTSLSKPFQGRLKEGQLFSPEHSIAQMANVIETVEAEQSGLCLAYDGSVIPA